MCLSGKGKATRFKFIHKKRLSMTRYLRTNLYFVGFEVLKAKKIRGMVSAL